MKINVFLIHLAWNSCSSSMHREELCPQVRVCLLQRPHSKTTCVTAARLGCHISKGSLQTRQTTASFHSRATSGIVVWQTFSYIGELQPNCQKWPVCLISVRPLRLTQRPKEAAPWTWTRLIFPDAFTHCCGKTKAATCIYCAFMVTLCLWDVSPHCNKKIISVNYKQLSSKWVSFKSATARGEYCSSCSRTAGVTVKQCTRSLNLPLNK